MKIFVLGFLISCLWTSQVFAQVPPPGQEENPRGPRKQLATIIFCGLGGAVLGVSTLSFYGRPQERLSNIAVGFALGIIAGAVYTTYRTATKPYDQYQYQNVPGTLLEPEYNFQELDPMLREQKMADVVVPLGGYRWDF